MSDYQCGDGMIQFGLRIQELRWQKQWTQKDLAQKLGITPSMVAHYETGSRLPSLEILVAAAKLFHVTTDYLLGVVQSHDEVIDISGLTPEEVHSIELIIENYRKH